jgi:predicted nucleic acid-binding protein
MKSTTWRTANAAALPLSERHQRSTRDCTIAAAALAAGCETLLSEVMPDGLRINGRLRIANPFRTAD